MLTKEEILRYRQNGHLLIDPFIYNRLNPNSYNLTLHEDVILYEKSHFPLDMKNFKEGMKMTLPEGGFVLYPGEFLLGRTTEYTETRNLVPCIEGRSSIARLGLQVHASAGFGDIGYCGTWTLEMIAAVPVKIYPNVEICQICYFGPVGKITDTYQGKYQNAIDASPSLIHRELN